MWDLLDFLVRYWIGAPLPIAWAMAAAANVAIYGLGAFCMARFSDRLIAKGIAQRYDAAPTPAEQIGRELRWGISTCLILACTSLLTRELYAAVWPASIGAWLLQVFTFVIYYEIYSYGVHRLLHLRPLRRFHGVHHRSVITTPYSAYAVHPIEAVSIGLSAPLFMLLVDFSLGPAFLLHVFGMLFTVLIHANVQFLRWATPLNAWTYHHHRHHAAGEVNFGFTSRLLDGVFASREAV